MLCLQAELWKPTKLSFPQIPLNPMYKTNLSAKAVAPAGPPKAAAAAPKGGATSTTKESVQAPADSPLEVKPEDVTPFPCALPDDIVVEILASRFVRQIIFI